MMKTKYFLTALALPVLFAACSNEDLLTSNQMDENSNLVNVGENFSIAATRFAGDPATRTSWDKVGQGLAFKWMPTYPATGASGNTEIKNVSVVAPVIGLCWTGENVKGGIAISDKVYSNYKFIHNGWLKKAAEKADYKCDALQNGWTYDKATAITAATGLEGQEVQGLTFNAAPDGTVSTEINNNSGIFKTDLSTMFGGSYIAYYPYNEKFIDSEAIPATSPANLTFKLQKGDDGLKDVNLAANTFAYAYAKDLVGGTTASDFYFKNLSGLISLQLTGNTTETITKVALYNENGFITSVAISAQKIKEGLRGTDLYCANTAKTSKTLVAEIKVPEALSATAAKYYLPALPTTTKDLKVILYDVNDKVAIVPATLTDNTIEAGKGKTCKASAIDADFKADVLVAVDGASFTKAIAKATTDAAKATPVTIKVIGDIALTAATIIPPFTTVTGDKIIVPESIVLTLADNSIMESNIDIKGSECCTNPAKAGGKLRIQAATVKSVVNVYAKDELAGAGTTDGLIEFIADKTSTISGTINNYGTVTLLSGTSITERTIANVTGAFNNYKVLNITKAAASTNNDAKLNIATTGSFNNKTTGLATIEGVLAINGAANTVTNAGTIVDKISSQVTGAISTLNAPGYYISEVDNNGNRFNDALNARPTTTIRFVSPATPADVYYDMSQTIGCKAASSITTYEVASEKVIFYSSQVAEVKIQNLQVNAIAKDFVVKTKTATNPKMEKFTLDVTEKVTVAATGAMKISCSGDKNDRNRLAFKAADVLVDGNMTFDNSLNSELGAFTVSKSGVATFEKNSNTNVTGQIDVKGKATIVLASGSTTGDVAGVVWYNTLLPKGNENWENGIPTSK